MLSAVGSTGLHPRTTAYCNSDGRFAQIASWQYCSMAWLTRYLIVDYESLDAIIARDSRAGSSRLWGAAPNKHRSGARWERSYCSQRRRSIRYARADRHPGTHQLRKQLGPLADHNRVREHQGAPRQISLSKLFANSIATFAFMSARSAHIRRYFWN